MILTRRTQKLVDRIEKVEKGTYERMPHIIQHMERIISNCTTAREQMYLLERKAKGNWRKFTDLSQLRAQMESGLTSDNVTMTELISRIFKTYNTSKQLKLDAEKVASPKVLQDLEDLTNKIWDITDPSSPNSVDVVDARLQLLEQQYREFDKALAARVKKIMMRRFRRGTNLWRRSLRRLQGPRRHRRRKHVEDLSQLPGAELGLYG